MAHLRAEKAPAGAGAVLEVKRQRLTVLLAAAPTLAATLLAALARVLLLLTAATLALPAAALLTGLTGLLVLLVVAAALTTLAWLALVRICHTRDSILCCWDHSRRSTRHQPARFRLLCACRKLEMLRFVACEFDWRCQGLSTISAGPIITYVTSQTRTCGKRLVSPDTDAQSFSGVTVEPLRACPRS